MQTLKAYSYKGPLVTSFPLELRLILSFCQLSLHNEESLETEIKNLIPGITNWHEFLRLTRYHRMVPVVGKLLKSPNSNQLFESVPTDIKRSIERLYNRNSMKAVQATGELVILVKKLQSEGIRVISLKGPSLALQLHSDAGARHQGDIDLLARQIDFHALHSILINEGYSCDSLPAESEYEQFLTWNHHFEYTHTEKHLQIELHSRLFVNRHFCPLSIEAALMYSDSILYGNTQLDILSLPHNLLDLFAHGANHAWLRLKWLMDIASFIQILKPDDWKQLSQLALEKGLERTVAQGLLLSKILLNTPIPPLIENAERFEPAFRYAGKHLCQQPLSETAKSNYRQKAGEKFHALKHARYRMKLKKEPAFKKGILQQLFHNSSGKDRNNGKTALSPSHYVLKPASWFYRKFIKNKLSKKQARE